MKIFAALAILAITIASANAQILECGIFDPDCSSHKSLDDHLCKSYGLPPGTQAYAACRIQLETTYRNNQALIRAMPDTYSRPSVMCNTIGGITHCY